MRIQIAIKTKAKLSKSGMPGYTAQIDLGHLAMETKPAGS
jgi:hypothetical protein